MTEVATRPTNGTIAVNPGDTVAVLVERYPALDPSGEAMELLIANVGDIEEAGLSFGDMDRITIPPAGSTKWLVPDLEQGEINVDKLVGVILKWETSRAYWVSEDVTGEAPDCASRDGKTPVEGGLFAVDGERGAENPAGVTEGGTEYPAGSCIGCPMNQFGSDSRGRGKACKESKLLYLVREGELLPTIISLPPTSIKPLKSFLLRVGTKMRAKFYEIEVGLALKAEVGGPGGKQKYGVVVPSVVRTLDPEERKVAKGASIAFNGMFNRVPVAAIGAGVAAGEAADTQAES